MKSVEFCYWLQGLFELGKPVALTEEQTAMVKAHLDMVFIHEIDPSYPKKQQIPLTAAHAQNPNLSGMGGRVSDVLLRC